MADDILVWDIETTPNIGTFWRPGFKLTVPWANISTERQICVIGYKWLSQKRVHSLCWEDQDDAAIVEQFVPILESARFSVAHNGRAFDEKWLRGRAMFHGIPMAPYHVMADTYLQFKRHTLLNSNALDYLGEYFNLGRKIQTSYALWQRIMLEDHQPSLQKMARYCRQDVQLLADLYELSRRYFPAPDSIAESIVACPFCASRHVIESKRRNTAALGKRLQLHCVDCGQYHTVAAGRYDKAKREAA